MMSDIEQHKPVLLEESIDALDIKPGGLYIDGTFGRGGHSQAIIGKIGPKGQLLVIDKDTTALDYGRCLFDGDQRVTFCHGSFANISTFASQHDMLGRVNGILLDLGVSSPQLDEAQRGFSFLNDGPLDMRMDTSCGEDAASWLQRAKEKEIADVLYHYGEERFSRRIARAIVSFREKTPITTTKILADIVKEANPAWEKHKHPATRSFQAIRIFINKELDDLQDCLSRCLDVLAVGGRLAVISFHSLEDRMVKRYFHRQEKGRVLPKEVPVTDQARDRRIKRIGKAVKPQRDEIEGNVRSRSAILRIGEKIR